MSRLAYVRPFHRQVSGLLSKLNQPLLSEARCFFGGGTRIVLELGEYRESRDIAFLCADQAGYRLLRETITATSLGKISTAKLSLARELRADQYGIRTIVQHGEERIKFEIIREARISLKGQEIDGIPVSCLSPPLCFAEKFLANADRGLDSSTLSRDIIDLAFMAKHWSKDCALEGFTIAEAAYGSAVQRVLDSALKKLKEEKSYRRRCLESLAITDTRSLNAGLKKLVALG